jgi:hypothetical protein
MSLLKGKFVDANNPLDGSRIKLDNNQALVAKKADASDKEVLKVDGSDKIQFLDLPQVSADPSSGNDIARKSWIDTQVSAKQNSLGTGTTSQFLRGDLTWQEVATSVGIAQTKIVSKGGSDVTGDGTLSKPYATIAAAMASITDASPTKRYAVKVEAGAYTEGALLLKANVWVVGDLKEAVRVTATSVGLDSSFTGTADNRGGMAKMVLTAPCNFDWTTATSGAGKLYFTEVYFNSAVSLNGYNNAIAQAQFDSCIFSAAITISGINVGIFKDNICFNNITLNQHPSGGMATILNAAGGYCAGTVRFNTTVNDFNRRCAGFLRAFPCENLIIDGVSSYADVDLISQGKTSTQKLNSGNFVALNSKIVHDLETQMLKPISTNAHNLGDWNKQWNFTFSQVYGSSGTDLYLLSTMANYDPAGDTVGRGVFINADGYGLQANVSGGNIELETAAVSGTGVRGKVQVKARELDLTSSKITNLADGTNAQDAVTKSQLDTAIAGVTVDVIDDSITDGVTDRAPSQNAVYDALSLKLDQASKGAANGVAELDGTGKVPSSQLPAIAITNTSVVSSEAAMLALTAEKGDVAVRTDLNKSFILAGTDPTVLADWQELLTPTDAVISVNGQTGSVSLDTDDVAEGATNKYFSASAAKAAAVADSITNGVTDVAPSQNAVHDALAGKADSVHTHVAADVTDFDSSAKAAAVVNSTAGTETDQAASVSAMKSYVGTEIAAILIPEGKKERKILTSTDITNGYVDLSFEAMAYTMIVQTGGVVHNEGSGDDYVCSVVGGVTRVTFEPDFKAILAAGDDIYFQYLVLA